MPRHCHQPATAPYGHRTLHVSDVAPDKAASSRSSSSQDGLLKDSSRQDDGDHFTAVKDAADIPVPDSGSEYEPEPRDEGAFKIFYCDHCSQRFQTEKACSMHRAYFHGQCEEASGSTLESGVKPDDRPHSALSEADAVLTIQGEASASSVAESREQVLSTSVDSTMADTLRVDAKLDFEAVSAHSQEEDSLYVDAVEGQHESDTSPAVILVDAPEMTTDIVQVQVAPSVYLPADLEVSHVVAELVADASKADVLGDSLDSVTDTSNTRDTHDESTTGASLAGTDPPEPGQALGHGLLPKVDILDDNFHDAAEIARISHKHDPETAIEVGEESVQASVDSTPESPSESHQQKQSSYASADSATDSPGLAFSDSGGSRRSSQGDLFWVSAPATTKLTAARHAVKGRGAGRGRSSASSSAATSAPASGFRSEPFARGRQSKKGEAPVGIMGHATVSTCLPLRGESSNTSSRRDTGSAQASGSDERRLSQGAMFLGTASLPASAALVEATPNHIDQTAPDISAQQEGSLWDDVEGSFWSLVQGSSATQFFDSLWSDKEN